MDYESDFEDTTSTTLADVSNEQNTDDSMSATNDQTQISDPESKLLQGKILITDFICM